MDQQWQADRTGDYEVMSQVTGSKSSGRSSRSSASAAATKAKAKAEAALVEAKYAAQEVEMMKEKARIEAENQKMLAEAEQRKAELEANLYVLKVNRSAKAASAEAAVYEAAAAREPDTLEGITQIYPEDRTQRTNEYVQAHYVTPNAQQQAPVSQESPAMPMSAERARPDPIQWYPIHDQEPRLSKLCIKDEGMPGAQNRGYSPWVPAPMSHSSSLRDYACEPEQITDLTKYLQTTDHASDIIQTAPLKLTDNLGLNVFQRNPDDDKTALSIEDKIFLEIMEREVYMDDDNHWVAPLPFRMPRPLLPNNREQALKRLTVLLRTLEKRKDMKEQFIEFMQKIFDNDQAEEAPPLEPGEEC
ncbi:hypothetical protein MHYP_G00087670 [Metynnis hypsauchen]